MNLQLIIADSLAGDEKAKKIIYDKIYSTIYATCMKYSPTEGEDYTQDCLIRVFDILHLFTGDSVKHLCGWVKRICINYVLVEKKRKKIKISWEANITNVPYEESVSNELKYTDEEVQNAIDKLSKHHRTIFNLFVREGYSHKEIGEKLNIDDNASKASLYLAKKRLKALLEKADNKQENTTL